jgi:CHAD domain-containing protein
MIMAPSAHTETERKYDLKPGDELPRLGDIPGVTKVSKPRKERLDAIYFDTADFRLARHGATLRRRAGGEDAGWHLKVPTGPDAKVELRMPLNGVTNAPPDELADMATALVRGAPLRPVVLMKTKRVSRRLVGRKGRPVAEVTDDTVTARYLGAESTVDKWREVEVELAGQTDPAVLDRAEKVLRKAGVRRSARGSKLERVVGVPRERAKPLRRKASAGDVVLAYVRAQYEQLIHHDLRARQGGEDAVHQMRVAARRMRSVLHVFGKIVDGERTKALRTELQWLGHRLSAARSLEVQHARFREILAELPDKLVVGPVGQRLTRHFSPAEANARRTMLKTLNGKRYRRLLNEIDRLLTDPPLTKNAKRRAKDELPTHVATAYLKTEKRLRAAKRLPKGEKRDLALHDARKAAKRYRYAAECAELVIGKPAKQTHRRVKDMTEVLGDHQDAAEALPVLRDLGVRAHLAGLNAFTFGIMHERENARRASAERLVPHYWRRVKAKLPSKWPTFRGRT